MKYKLFNIIVLLFVLVFPVFFVYGAENEKEARKKFDKKQFEQVIEWYETQHKSNPENADYAYRYGVCLSETAKMGQNALKVLLQASEFVVPDDVFFYIAKNYHALSDYQNARVFYQHYESLASRSEKRAFGLDSLLQQSENRYNPFVGLLFVEPIVEIVVVEEEEPPAPPVVPQSLSDNLIEFSISYRIIYRHISQFREVEALRAYINGWAENIKLDSLSNLIKQKREAYTLASSPSEKDKLSDEILDIESEWLSVKPNVDDQYLFARKKEMAYWENASENYLFRLKNETDSLLAIYEEKLKPVEEEVQAYDQAIEDFVGPLMVEDPADSAGILIPGLPPVIISGVVYKVQIGTYKGKLPARVDQLFKRLSILRKIDVSVNEKGLDVYTIGELTNFDDALMLQQQIRLEGIKDAFVVAYHNEKRITLEEAKKISVQ